MPDAGASLVVAAVRIQDFRVLRDLCLDLDPATTVLIGENNTGKTAVLAALDRAIGGAPSNEDDLHVDAAGVRAPHFVVDVRIQPAGGDDFDDDLSAVFGGAVQPPVAGGAAFVTIRTTGSVNADGSGVGYRREFIQGWECDRNAAAASATVPGERVDRNRLGLLAFTLLDASRDLLGELRRRTSHWGQLLSELGIDPTVQSAIQNDLEALGDRIRDESAALTAVQQSLSRLTSALASGAEAVDVSPLPPRLDELGRGMDVLVTAPGSAKLPLRQQGSGSRSLTSLLVFRAFVELRQGADRPLKPHAISGFEEPEAHLHPHAQQVAVRQLDDFPGQRIITTHSPQIGAVSDLRALRRFQRDGPTVEIRRLGAACAEDEVQSLRRWVMRRTPEVLFARLVVLVEGETDEAAIRVLAQFWWAGDDVAGLGLSVVSVDGAQQFANVAPCLESLGIPWLILADGDGEGVAGVASVSTRVGHDVTLAPERAQLLPAGADFEQYLIDAGHRSAVETAVAQHHGATALPDYRATNDGNKLRGGGVRDYQSSSWEDRLAVDYLKSHKGALGGLVAEQIVGGGAMPLAFHHLFRRAREILGGSP